MSKNSEFELDLDLQLLPEWARQPANVNRYAKYEGQDENEPRRRRGDRPGGFRGQRPDRSSPRGDRRGPGPQRPGDRREGGPRGDHPRDRGRRGGPRRPLGDEIQLPPIDVSLVPEEAGVGSLAHQIKLTGRAYPLFDIAALILKRVERYHIEFEVRKNEAGEVLQPLFTCSLDDSVWLSEGEVAAHVLARHFDTLYQTEKVPTDPPKGTYTLVAQCPLSNVILGPPNLHDYNVKLRKLHTERFARMPFEVYKSRIRMVTDEAIVKQWIEEQSFRNEYTCLNVPEPLKLSSREEVEQHFRENHLPNLARNVPKARFAATGQWPPMSRGLRLLLQRTVEEQRRFPLKVATVLSQQFARHGLQFFKVNKTVTHVCVARPHYLDLDNTVVSNGVRRIVEYIRAHEGCTRRSLLQDLAPSAEPAMPAPDAAASAAAEAAPTPAPAPGSPAEAPSTPGGESAPPASDESAATAAAAPASAGEEGSPAPSTAAASAPAPSTEPQPTPEQAAVIADLHWLVHQGHVIEFTNGLMELAKPPRPRPEPARKKTPPPSASTPAAAATEESTGTPAASEAPPAPSAPPEAAVSPAESGTAPEEPPAKEPPPEPRAETKPGETGEAAALPTERIPDDAAKASEVSSDEEGSRPPGPAGS